MSSRPGRWQTVLESIVGVLGSQIREIVRRDPTPFLPLIGTLFVFIAAANLSGLVPDVRPPTASVETPAALAIVVFLSVHAFGIRARGVRHYLKSYLEPNPLMLPLNILSEITRTFSLMVRLFGNIMSHELIIGIVVSLAGLLVPLPFMALGILIGFIQAYIFAVLATVFVGAAVGAVEKG
jgi:F-type H+-transporting ATPase subunit a